MNINSITALRPQCRNGDLEVSHRAHVL